MAAHEQMRMFGNIIIAEAPTSPEDVVRGTQGHVEEITPVLPADNLDLHVDSHGCRILVADDAPTSRLIIREMLEEAGYIVETVENGEELVRRVQSHMQSESDAPLSLVLTDIEMPIMGGLEAAHKIRALEAGTTGHRRLPIIAITAHALAEERERFLVGGIDYVVTKPLKPQDLTEALIYLTAPSPGTALTPSSPQPDTLCSVLCELTTRLWQEVTSPPSPTTEHLPPKGIDIADVFERSGESPRRTKLILSAFLDSYQAPLLTLKHARETTDLKKVTVAAHSLKGLLLDVGASHTAERAAGVEQLLKSGDYRSAAASCETLTAETYHVATLVERVVRHFPSLG
jgi:CheY-like chemotaxis protein